MVEYLPKWAKIDELINLVQFVGVQRPGHTLDTPYPVMTVDVPLIDSSSSQIRQMIYDGESIRYLVPDTVAEFITKEGLYRDWDNLYERLYRLYARRIADRNR